jgi:hypothetical protein
MASIFDLNEWPTPATYLYEEYASMLSERLRRRFPHFDSEWIHDAVINAILDISLKIDQLDNPDDLGGLLSVAAWRKLMESARSEQARRCRQEKKGRELVVQQQAAAREEWETVADKESLQRILAQVPQNGEERTVLEHWSEGYHEIACALGWQDVPEPEQRSRVKTIRDRLAQRLKRFLEE